MIPRPQQNDFKTAKEAIVLVEISFNNLSRIIRFGDKRINLTDEWKECVIDSNLCKDYFVRRLETLENDCLFEPAKDFNEAREAYLNACFKRETNGQV